MDDFDNLLTDYLLLALKNIYYKLVKKIFCLSRSDREAK